MPTSPRRLLTTLLAPAVLLTACSGDDDEPTAASTSSTSASSQTSESAAEESAAEESGPDLASGLLTADAFGPDAAVVAVSPEQLRQGMGLATDQAADLTITPETCVAAVQGAQPSFDDVDDIAAESATTGTSVTVEVLVRGGPTKGAVTQLAEAAQRCPQATISSPGVGQAVVSFETLPVQTLGDRAALMRYTTAVTLPDGSQATVPALIGAVQDGDRLLVLMNIDTGTGTGAVLDPAAFADLLAEAYDVQAPALD